MSRYEKPTCRTDPFDYWTGPGLPTARHPAPCGDPYGLCLRARPHPGEEHAVASDAIARAVQADMLRRFGPDSLDAAWVEAEAALPEGMHIVHVSRAEDSASDPDPDRPGYLRSRFFYVTDGPETWEAMAANVPFSTEWVDQWAEFGYGATPALALRALAAKLREAEG